jgi:hypothetical protein
MNKRYTVFSGCSYTAGTGFELEKNEPTLWVNQLYDKCFSHTTKLNLGQGGRSNAGIFQDTMQALVSYSVDYAIVEWTNTPRYELELGFELYSTRQVFMPRTHCPSVNTHSINYSSDYLNKIRDRFTTLAHDCYEILNLVNYVNTILKVSKLTNTQVFFVNGMCLWDQDFFAKKLNCLPDQYTKYTQQLLNSNTRNDEEVFKLYHKMHNNFDNEGTINQSHWLNLYNSMRSQRIDVNQDNIHPGIQSNNLYAEQFSNTLKQLL